MKESKLSCENVNALLHLHVILFPSVIFIYPKFNDDIIKCHHSTIISELYRNVQTTFELYNALTFSHKEHWIIS